MQNLTRPSQGRILAGVCAGLGNKFGRSPWAIRALFVISTVLPGPQFIIYIVLWVLMEDEHNRTRG